jgi:hypothetical protein
MRSWCLTHVFSILLQVVAKVVEDCVNQVLGLLCGKHEETEQHLIRRLLSPVHIGPVTREGNSLSDPASVV